VTTFAFYFIYLFIIEKALDKEKSGKKKYRNGEDDRKPGAHQPETGNQPESTTGTRASCTPETAHFLH
jgi:hypothetical protein